MKAPSLVVGLLACVLTLPAIAIVTPKAPEDKPLIFSWELSWDGATTLAARHEPTLKYWVPVFSIVDLDNDSQYDDLDVQLKHRGIGPKEDEGIDHAISELYHFKLNNALDKLPQLMPPTTQNAAGSIKQIAHPGTGVAHRDDVRLEFKRVGHDFTFKLIGVHVASAVPEPGSWAMAITGLLTLSWALARRRDGKRRLRP
jgi:hypothetical protein